MKTKLFLVSTLVTVQLFSQTLTLQKAPENPVRIAPNNGSEIFSFNNSIKDSIKSIVNISTKRHVKNQLNNLPLQMLNEPLFKKFFGDDFSKQFKKNRIQRALGSGIILSKNGYIVTNNHVIANAEEITVTINGNNSEYNAKLIGKDPDSDLAVIKIDANNLTPIKFATSDNLMIGDVVFAIGNPFGIGSAVTQGIISALNKNKVGINRYENYIQTDASINPGNSGGALVDSRGALIGLNTAIVSKSGGNNGIGFAIPANMIKDVVTKLVSDGKVTRGYLGVIIGNLDSSTAKVYKRKNGALVLNVGPNTPATNYGIKRGDLIYEINGKKVKNRSDLQNTIGSFKPNQKIKIKLERNKKDLIFNIVLADRTNAANIINNNGKILGGLELNNLTPSLKKEFRISNKIKGILITDVKPKSKSEKAGFQAGDVIIQAEDTKIENFTNLQSVLNNFKDKYKKIYVNRYGKIILLVIK